MLGLGALPISQRVVKSHKERREGVFFVRIIITYTLVIESNQGSIVCNNT